LATFFKAAYDSEKVLFSTFLLTGLRELEVVHLFWTDLSFELQTVRVTAKPELGFYPKRWEEREVPIPVQLIGLLKAHPRRTGCNFVFSSSGARSCQIRLKDISIHVRVAHAADRLGCCSLCCSLFSKLPRIGYLAGFRSPDNLIGVALPAARDASHQGCKPDCGT
jgi:hypothetical protein